MAGVSYRGVTRRYPGVARPALEQLDLKVEEGEFLVLVGPSGCGKSTTLRMLAGLEPVDDGEIWIGDRDVTSLPPKDRDIAMVFQSYALYPHMTVGENIGFHLKISKLGKAERAKRVLEAAKLLDLEPYLDRKPAKLSGGQRQRVAMGRAIVRRPQVFLMDEPLSNLDAKLRVQTRTQIASLQRRLGVTTLYVTHDQTEAMTMGDRVAVLKDGELQQCDTPVNLFSRPVNLFVAGFIGSPAMNLLEAAVDGDTVRLGAWATRMDRAGLAGLTSRDLVIGVRPESWRITERGTGLSATIDVVEELGSDGFLYCRADIGSGTRPVTVRTVGMSRHRPGDRLNLTPVTDHVHLFDKATGLRLGSQ
ncbi:Glycerol-3-phosphate ABC transporter, ATP-binding protein UgpC (TC 3.A.1.1.3) [Alloactinosynnema sp. L-07]|uniref:ABC transporter ATP-binding protein n=1 Tax=Alloactinosynnema sp. L-07 TaxID=1653480 RepID=UPI00065F0338|nr:sn-glycerol-3-phosphate ABC transporter ATP-binding protein UgpC [Alloactinosynnema sp. L-07]CRK56475.1 Glycerol-3-phosphate ABC transporter, ATP-binding protein UgpC (TC 3.A.1.1.3) [Alloactinosynnema sp. L-07]